MDALSEISVAAIAIVFFAYLGLRFGTWLGIPFLKRWSAGTEASKKNDEKRCSIQFDDERISMVNLRVSNAEPIHIEWAAIERITAFKRDLFAIDLICLGIELHDGRCLELDEDMDGWKPFIDAMPTNLIGCKNFHEWFFEVAFPAFATNPIEIFRREVVAE